MFQRFLTSSEYDHVAIVYRDSYGDIRLFEAMSSDGVVTTYWPTFLESKWNDMYEKVTYRRLHFDRKEETMKTLEKFIQVLFCIFIEYQRK